ncbi:MAG: malate synthase [Alphaproteobacteria bacterium]|jgi:malate synthase
MNMPAVKYGQIHQAFYSFINDEVLPLVTNNQALNIAFNKDTFWADFENLVAQFSPRNQLLLQTRQILQTQIDAWHKNNKSYTQQEYQAFLTEIGYLSPAAQANNCIVTQNVDDEIAHMAGPQLVVPVTNARFALNAANARWGSLYDALYGTDIIPTSTGEEAGGYDETRGASVIEYAKRFLDENVPLAQGSHKDVKSYVVYYHHLLAFFEDGTQTGLETPCQFVALCGHKCEPDSILLKHNGLHIELVIDSNGSIGKNDKAGIQDIRLESALTSIIDFEDSVATVDAQDKIHAYRNWLGLMQGNLRTSFTKNGVQETRTLNPDITFTGTNGEDYTVSGRALMLVRNVGHLMDTELMQDQQGNLVPEGIIDAVVTSMIGMLDLQKDSGIRNSRAGSIYIVKPKMHGPKEVAFTCDLFSAVEKLLGLVANTIKLGIMDEERRTSANLAQCIEQAKERLVFINTGFLDRTGDEIHTSFQAGPFLPKGQIKQQPWIKAYESRNVNIGIECGLLGIAQIGKGMWAMPNEMQQMMQQKVDHVQSGASTAWVPSPTAATLHAMHYHQVNVSVLQAKMLINQTQPQSQLTELLSIPLLPEDQRLSESEITQELANNIQGILGYVSRWIQLGIGCSTVPDINNVGLMEDRATLRISSQLIANWLEHKLCSEKQVDSILQSMAVIVDQQNESTPDYVAMTNDLDRSLAYNAARRLIFEGGEQPNGYTEPLLHYYRRLAKKQSH